MKEFFNIRRDRANRSRTQIITIVVCLMLAMAIAIGGTVAWLIDKTDSVEDTFTFGNVSIVLTDSETSTAWSSKQNDRLDSSTSTGTTNKLIPGQKISFDPRVQVATGSEPCYIFIDITLTADFESAFNGYSIDSAWKHLENGVYYYVGTTSNLLAVEENKHTAEIIDGGTITVNGTNVTNTTVSGLVDTDFSIRAYAIQRDNLSVSTPADIWALINSNS